MRIEGLNHAGRVVPDWLVQHKPRSAEEYAQYAQEKNADFVALTVTHEGKRFLRKKRDFILNFRLVTVDNQQFGFEQRIGDSSDPVKEEDELRILLDTCGIAKAITEMTRSRVIVHVGKHVYEYGNGNESLP